MDQIVSTKPGIAKCSFSHDAIAQWMIANPDGQLKECAERFGYTQSWLSCIIHSDAFQARYRELLAGADAAIINDIPAKIRGVASRALDGLADAVELAAQDEHKLLHRNFLLETSDKLLRDLGYGPQKAAVSVSVGEQNNQTNVFVGVDPTLLASARDRMLRVKERQGETIDVLLAPPTT